MVIDAQYDFLDNGKLGVANSIEKIDNLTRYVEEHGKDYVMAISTVDFHPITHCSFKENGGEWPTHCVQHSYGASIYEPLLQALNNNTKSFRILTKGMNEDHEEYSIFKNTHSCAEILKLCNVLGIEEIDMCGIALDYCVKDSAKDGKRYLPHIKFNIMKDFCPSIGNAETTLKDLKNNGFEII